MDTVKQVDDRIELTVDALTETTSQLFGRFVRAGRLSRELGLRKMLYVRKGPAADPVLVTQLVRDMPRFGLAGVRIAVLVSDLDATYPLAFVEGLALHCGVEMRVVPALEEALAFLNAT